MDRSNFHWGGGEIFQITMITRSVELMHPYKITMVIVKVLFYNLNGSHFIIGCMCIVYISCIMWFCINVAAWYVCCSSFNLEKK